MSEKRRQAPQTLTRDRYRHRREPENHWGGRVTNRTDAKRDAGSCWIAVHGLRGVRPGRGRIEKPGLPAEASPGGYLKYLPGVTPRALRNITTKALALS